MWSNDIKCEYMFMPPLKKLARKGLTTGYRTYHSYKALETKNNLAHRVSHTMSYLSCSDKVIKYIRQTKYNIHTPLLCITTTTTPMIILYKIIVHYMCS